MSKMVPPKKLGRRVEGGNTVLHESAPGGMRKIRCPNTHQLATPSRERDGSTVLQGPGGVKYVSRRLR